MTEKKVLEKTAEAFGVSVEDICGPGTKEVFTVPRHTAQYILRNRLGYTQQRAAEAVGRTRHTATIHACSHIDSRIQTADPASHTIIEVISQFGA